ncbi:cartilage oligomeric matrix protein-like isoform X2 [Xenia sp. Carnegie-2017]|uniref:cartilage oligomeric matrix protein-like isoform X2 n=1 Tax=Xenia sp. Carnegie-2017 TaxID=2897299 RepID=UPI001F04C097|nr:cartilage oligomeric matrix protein-like isoform X2 [Xenia sp. Carnegie-2017]
MNCLTIVLSFLCLSTVYTNEVSLMDDFEQDLSLGLQKVENVTRYCYRRRNGNTNSKIKASSQIRDRFIKVMQSDMFSLTSQIKIKQLRGTAQFVLFAVQRRTDRKKLFVWWINVSRKLVGISFMDNSKRMRILYFSNVPLEAKRWFELKLEFDGFLKSKPIVELFVNDTKVGRKVLTNVFRDKSTINVKDLEVRVAEMWGLTDKYSAPKVCMKQLKIFTSIIEVAGGISDKSHSTVIAKADMNALEVRLTESLTAACDKSMAKLMENMKMTLKSCGLCDKSQLPIVEPVPNITTTETDEPYPNKTTIEDQVDEEPCPPGLNSCHRKATCVPNVLAGGNHCECKLGFAGNGYSCAKDTDLDGFPDKDIPNCKEKQCRKDNCVSKPNSGQENTDEDELGDACDEDADNDGLLNGKDNCPFNYNPSQNDADGDRIGDACDNCVDTRNRNQVDTDRDGRGDACVEDLDGDEITERDNCPLIKNKDQKDSDGDGHGDKCDNCPFEANPGQEDVDQDLVGDVCDSNIDRDKDGVNDDDDNCVNTINPGQLDTDLDGMGDECDPDDDNDGILDDVDNCRLTKNEDQEVDPLSRKYGIACQGDYDGDNITNNEDSCPENKNYGSVSFVDYQTINLDPKEEEQIDPVWKVLDHGKEISQIENSDPGMAIGKQSFRGVDYYGTIYVDTNVDNDYFGIIFGYQSSSKFYAVMWKKLGQIYWDKEPFEAIGRTGLSIKVVNSNTGPGPELRNALWNTDSTENQVRTLWHDTRELGWTEKTAYHWQLRYRPNTGYIRLKIFDGKKMVIDTGVLHDKTYSGGRIGVMSFSQEKVSWSKIFYRCNDGSVK